MLPPATFSPAGSAVLHRAAASLLSPHGRLLSLGQPQVMGILNLTPDSFFAGSRVASERDLLTRAEAMLAAGAAVLDLGAYSTRPGADHIAEAEETARLLPALAAVRAGADLVNDVGGGTLDADMFATVGRLRVPYVLMHLRGTPQTMARLTDYDGDIVLELLRYFRDRLAALRAAGVVDVVLDPGFGFAKTVAQSHELLRRLPELQALGCPLLAGLSRKRMVYGPLGLGPEAALNGTTALHMVALQGGARLLRAHDVAEARQTIDLFAHTFPDAE